MYIIYIYVICYNGNFIIIIFLIKIFDTKIQYF